MKLYTYVVARDYGFAPNPFYGYCTLATCKSQIRSTASIDDWVIGTGAKDKFNLSGHLIYAMKIQETMDFNTYWNDKRFLSKRPILNGSLKQLYGDNIYCRYNDQWIQINSHHSLENGQPNERNIKYDLRTNRVLISRKFVYYGSGAIEIPEYFRLYQPTREDLCCDGRGHRIKSNEMAVAFEDWLINENKWGVQGFPIKFKTHQRIA